jgi:hypothetical protein
MPSELKNIFNLRLILAVPPENTASKQLVAFETHNNLLITQGCDSVGTDKCCNIVDGVVAGSSVQEMRMSERLNRRSTPRTIRCGPYTRRADLSLCNSAQRFLTRNPRRLSARVKKLEARTTTTAAPSRSCGERAALLLAQSLPRFRFPASRLSLGATRRY